MKKATPIPTLHMLQKCRLRERPRSSPGSSPLGVHREPAFLPTGSPSWIQGCRIWPPPWVEPDLGFLDLAPWGGPWGGVPWCSLSPWSAWGAFTQVVAGKSHCPGVPPGEEGMPGMVTQHEVALSALLLRSPVFAPRPVLRCEGRQSVLAP